MKAFNILFGMVFLLFAILQYNDVDPYLWIPIYASASTICILNSSGRYSLRMHLMMTIFCVAYALFLFINTNGVFSWINEHETESLVQSMKATKPWIEQTREFGGLMIILLVGIVNIVLHKKSGANKPRI